MKQSLQESYYQPCAHPAPAHTLCHLLKEEGKQGGDALQCDFLYHRFRSQLCFFPSDKGEVKSCCCNYSENSIRECYQGTKRLQTQHRDIFQNNFSKSYLKYRIGPSQFNLFLSLMKVFSSVDTCTIGILKSYPSFGNNSLFF